MLNEGGIGMRTIITPAILLAVGGVSSTTAAASVADATTGLLVQVMAGLIIAVGGMIGGMKITTAILRVQQEHIRINQEKLEKRLLHDIERLEHDIAELRKLTP